MQAAKIVLRITKILGKVILGVVIVLLIVVALVHLPPVQKQITRKLSTFLSAKTEARVDIQRITFSILGNVAIEDLVVWDPNNTKIFSAHQVEVTSSIFNLIKGDFIFDHVHIEGVDFKLIQHKEGLNIQFILDAFKSKEKKTTTTSNPVTLQFKDVLLENVMFEFNSTVSGVSVGVNLGMFKGNEAEFSTNPITIKADQAMLENSAVNTFSTTHSDTLTVVASNNNLVLSPDFGTGIVIEIKDFTMKNDDFSFHRDQVVTTRKFEPAHIELKKIQLMLTDFIMHKDTLAAGIQSFTAQLPGFTLTEAKAAIRLSQNQIVLSKLHLTSGSSDIHADLSAPNNLNPENKNDHLAIGAQCLINPKDFGYFLSDSLINHFNSWGPTMFAAEATYSLSKGKIKTLDLKTGNSQLHTEGMVNDAFDLKKISWQDMAVNASIGSDFKKILTSFLRTINLPPVVTLQLKSSGNLNKIFADVNVFSKWGDVKANGLVAQQANNLDIDINLTGEKVDPGQWLNLSWIGPMDLSVDAKGIIGDDQNIEINGLIDHIEMMNQPIHHIGFKGTAVKDSATVGVSIKDPNYRSEIHSEISFAGPLMFTNTIQLDSFKLGRLLHRDSTLFISGNTKSEIIIDSSSLEGFLVGKPIRFHKQSMEYALDTMYIHALLSPTKSDFMYFTNYAKTNLVSNFDIRDASEVIQYWSENILKGIDNNTPPTGNRTANLTIDLENPSILKLLGIAVDDFSSLRVNGEFDEQKQTATLHATSGNFKGYGISFDTLHTNLMALHDTLSSRMNVKNLLYNSIQLGNLDVDVVTKRDTAVSNFRLANDTLTLLGVSARSIRSDSGMYVYPDKLLAFDHDYFIDPENPVFIGSHNVAFNHFKLSRDDIEIKLDGDLNYFDVSLRKIDLTPLNLLLSPDTTLINKGHLTGQVSYSRDQQFNLQANIDSLSIYNSSPVTITAASKSEGNHVPFQFQLTNPSNKIDLKGQYFPANTEVDATLLLDVNNLELFSFLVSNIIDEMNGSLKGETSISGPIQKPALKGYLQFVEVGLTTVNPKLTFNIEDDRITLDHSALTFNNFTLYDQDHHPLTIDGSISSKDYESFAYDLHLNSDQYSLINNPDSTSGKLRGVLVIDSDIKLKGDGKDTNVEANLTIKGATDLTVVNSSNEIELLKAEGIVDFVDPALLMDSTALEPSANFYDSLIASLPDFNLNSTVTIEDNAIFRLIVDEQSGDYIEASGGANLELGYDRSGNLSLTGDYTIKKGVYRLSFYDLVKKNFNLAEGSSINWHGSPKNGDLNIKAVHMVESNSIGLIGHEIGENEKSIYKRSLDYQVGINIIGTIEKPIISFSLDLPQNEKVSYPVLANKLDRLRQPEYASELNKQVFGLLVLGGFLPESSADVNSSVIATTALSNSVNSLLASQLNRFASQYVKGVNIDVGIQSYSDYSAPGGKTQTAMDFRVSKRIMNDRLAFEIGGDFDINQDQSGANTGTKNYRGDIAIIYDLTGNGDKQLKLFNNETYDIIYQEIRNTGISLIFIREFENKKKDKSLDE